MQSYVLPEYFSASSTLICKVCVCLCVCKEDLFVSLQFARPPTNPARKPQTWQCSRCRLFLLQGTCSALDGVLTLWEGSLQVKLSSDLCDVLPL